MSARQPDRGTTYLSVDAFLNCIAKAIPGERIVYATGDLAYSAVKDPQLFALRSAAWRLYETKKISLTQRPRQDRRFVMGGRAFDYVATVLREKQDA